MKKSALTIALLLAACGGGEPAEEPHDEGHSGGEHHGHHGHHEGHGEHHPHHEGHDDHGELSAGVEAFHDAFAPIWHSESGAARGERACAELDSLVGLAGAVEGGDALGGSLEALREPCAAGDGAAADGHLSEVHDQLHALMGH